MIDSEVISNYGYGAAVLGALIEGDGVAILAGIAARHGYLLYPLTAVCVALGGFIGDQTLFFLGRRYGDRILGRVHDGAVGQARQGVALGEPDEFSGRLLPG